MDSIISLASGSLGGALVVWLLRNWLLERLRRSIEHEYATKLETHKAELSGQLASISRDFEGYKLRTSLAFEHRRGALAAILAEIVTMRDKWVTENVDYEVNFVGPVPHSVLAELRNIFYRQQLFLDRASVSAVQLLIDIATDSLPFSDGERTHARDGDGPLEDVTYLTPLIAELFRDRLGIEHSAHAERSLTLLGAIRLVNRYHFQEIDLPASGPLRVKEMRVADALIVANANSVELVSKLHEFRAHLHARQMGVFHEAYSSIERYLAVLDPNGTESLPLH